MSLGKNIFQNCVKLQNFQIPSTYKELSEGMFSGCTTLQDVDFTKANSLKVIGIRCFRNCSGIVEMTLSDNVKFINPEAFNGCKQLKKLILPDELEAFVPALANTQTFANCPVLSMAPKSKAKQLKSNQILIPDGITHITACCFMNCTGITNVDLNNVDGVVQMAGDLKLHIAAEYHSARCSYHYQQRCVQRMHIAQGCEVFQEPHRDRGYSIQDVLFACNSYTKQ